MFYNYILITVLWFHEVAIATKIPVPSFSLWVLLNYVLWSKEGFWGRLHCAHQKLHGVDSNWNCSSMLAGWYYCRFGHFMWLATRGFLATNGIFRLSVCLSVCPSHLFDYVPIIGSSWNFQELLPMTNVRSMQKVKVRGQRSRSQRSQPNLTVSGL